MTATSPPLCPSANPDWAGARVFAVVGGTPAEPRAAYLDQTRPITAELLALAGPTDPAEVFRAAAPCAGGVCMHFDSRDQACGLARKTVRLVPVVVNRLPRCAIRADCQWWRQEGAAACRRCPQVVTLNPMASEEMRA